MELFYALRLLAVWWMLWTSPRTRTAPELAGKNIVPPGIAPQYHPFTVVPEPEG